MHRPRNGRDSAREEMPGAMKLVLVDTSVWVQHFRQPNPALVQMLAADAVLTQPMVLGEIACARQLAAASNKVCRS
jgi:hypothetical protein